MTRFFALSLVLSLSLLALSPLATASPLSMGLEWLQAHQNANGGFGDFNCWDVLCTPFPALALNPATMGDLLHHRLAEEGKSLKPTVHDISVIQDQELALVKLSTMGISIDRLTDEQQTYSSDYSAGT